MDDSEHHYLLLLNRFVHCPACRRSIASSLEAARRPLPVHLPHAAMGSEALRAALRRSAPALSEVSMDDSELGRQVQGKVLPSIHIHYTHLCCDSTTVYKAKLH